MKCTITYCIVLLSLTSAAFAQSPDKTDYQAYNANGDVLSWEEVGDVLSHYDVVLVGEQHNDSIGHLIEFDLLQAVHADTNRTAVAVSMEMFDRDVQYIVDEYLAGYISEKHFLKSSRSWDNYPTDYKPIVEYARDNQLALVAANAPRRYVNMISRLGLESLAELSSSAKQHLPPLPVAHPTQNYIDKWDAQMAEAMQHMPPDTSSADSEDPDYAGPLARMFAAQNVWDAGMAYSIARHLTDNPNSSVIHYVGSFHVESRSGLPDHLARYSPAAKIGIVYIHPVQNPLEFDADLVGTGDIVVQTQEPETIAETAAETTEDQ